MTVTTVDPALQMNSKPINNTSHSPVYSLDVHSEAVWLVSGTEAGAINLYTVRHDEGQCQYMLKRHNSPVSYLRISPDETGLLSGSWDKNILV
jgi:transcriptional activator SPT8